MNQNFETIGINRFVVQSSEHALKAMEQRGRLYIKLRERGVIDERGFVYISPIISDSDKYLVYDLIAIENGLIRWRQIAGPDR